MFVSRERPYCQVMGATPIPTELTTAWQLTLEFWNQPARHDTLLGVAAKHQEFAWLAGKYRDAARSNPSDVIAPERLPRVQRAAAIVMMSKTKPIADPMPKTFRAMSIMLIGAVLATGLGLVVADQKVQQHQQQSTTIARHP